MGASVPITMLWSMKTRTTASLAVAEIDAAAGTVAIAEMCFCLAPGTTTSVMSFVYWSLKGSANRFRAAVSSLSALSG